MSYDPKEPNPYDCETIRDWTEYIRDWGKRKGWTYEEKDVPEKLMLAVGELAEAMEEFRRHKPIYYEVPSPETGLSKPEGFAVELADCIIRLLHLCDVYKIDMHDMILKKMLYNEQRPYRHGNLRA
jgi:NTP pyrophosphatase (non-canonical NTP hydrolase)